MIADQGMASRLAGESLLAMSSRVESRSRSALSAMTT